MYTLMYTSIQQELVYISKDRFAIRSSSSQLASFANLRYRENTVVFLMSTKWAPLYSTGKDNTRNFLHVHRPTINGAHQLVNTPNLATEADAGWKDLGGAVNIGDVYGRICVTNWNIDFVRAIKGAADAFTRPRSIWTIQQRCQMYADLCMMKVADDDDCESIMIESTRDGAYVDAMRLALWSALRTIRVASTQRISNNLDPKEYREGGYLFSASDLREGDKYGDLVVDDWNKEMLSNICGQVQLIFGGKGNLIDILGACEHYANQLRVYERDESRRDPQKETLSKNKQTKIRMNTYRFTLEFAVCLFWMNAKRIPVTIITGYKFEFIINSALGEIRVANWNKPFLEDICEAVCGAIKGTTTMETIIKLCDLYGQKWAEHEYKTSNVDGRTGKALTEFLKSRRAKLVRAKWRAYDHALELTLHIFIQYIWRNEEVLYN